MMRLRRQRGAALLIALTVLAVVGLLSAVVVSTVTGGQRRVHAAARRDQLRNTAESGVVLAVRELKRNAAWAGAEALSAPGGMCHLRVARRKDGAYAIQSSSRAGRQAVWVAATVRLTDSGAEFLEWKDGRGEPPRP